MKAGPFEGMTRTRCATACGTEGCVISGKPYCAHPTKGGLHPVDMQNKPALARIAAARDALARDGLEADLLKRRH